MNTSSRHWSSFVAGAGALALTLGLLGMALPDRGGEKKAESVSSPRPQDLVRILEGDSFVVPTGKILVIKTLVGSGGSAFELKVNGQAILENEFVVDPQEYQLGVTATAGQTVTVEDTFPDPNNHPVALGFLADV
jgi:hypothetical protein